MDLDRPEILGRPPEGVARMHRVILIIGAVTLGALLFFTMAVMPYFVWRFGWGYNP